MFRARALRSSEAEVWRALRLDALRLFPTAFLTTVEEAANTPIERIRERLTHGHTFGVFTDMTEQTCCGVGSLIPLAYAQCAHRAEIGAFFVAPEHHGTPAADTLIKALLDHATQLGRWQVELHVAESNTRAHAFYERHGFEDMGRLPNATITDGKPIDDVFCVRIARQGAPKTA
jgi:ribosomal protein S18 acetylase RimI-like enzyme